MSNVHAYLALVFDHALEATINVPSAGYDAAAELVLGSDDEFVCIFHTRAGCKRFTAVLRDTNGTALKTVTKSYLPNWFEQVDSTTFFAGTAVGANQSISITVSVGSAIVYGSTTDNINNDPNIQFAVALFGIA